MVICPRSLPTERPPAGRPSQPRVWDAHGQATTDDRGHHLLRAFPFITSRDSQEGNARRDAVRPQTSAHAAQDSWARSPRLMPHCFVRCGSSTTDGVAWDYGRCKSTAASRTLRASDDQMSTRRLGKPRRLLAHVPIQDDRCATARTPRGHSGSEQAPMGSSQVTAGATPPHIPSTEADLKIV